MRKVKENFANDAWSMVYGSGWTICMDPRDVPVCKFIQFVSFVQQKKSLSPGSEAVKGQYWTIPQQGLFQ